MSARLLTNLTLLLGLAVAQSTHTLRAQEMPGPGPEHAELKRMVGEWTATIKTDQGESHGTMKCSLDCGGLWLVTEFQGDFGGLAFQGRGLDGYDPAQKKYVSVWVDSMSTKPLFLEGVLDKEKQTMTQRGEGPGPDGQNVRYKNVTRFVDADHHVFTMSIVGADGSETQMMTIEYTRKK